MDRKEFFSEAFKRILDKGLAILENSKIGKKLEELSEEPDRIVAKERPPGASASDKEFLSLCTGCDACMAACPINVITIEDFIKRDPLIYPAQGPCIHCPGYPCIAACPTGALHKSNGIKLKV